MKGYWRILHYILHVNKNIERQCLGQNNRRLFNSTIYNSESSRWNPCDEFLEWTLFLFRVYPLMFAKACIFGTMASLSIFQVKCTICFNNHLQETLSVRVGQIIWNILMICSFYFFSWGCIRENVHATELADQDDLINCMLVAGGPAK
jgi:hypothetical protein